MNTFIHIGIIKNVCGWTQHDIKYTYSIALHKRTYGKKGKKKLRTHKSFGVAKQNKESQQKKKKIFLTKKKKAQKLRFTKRKKLNYFRDYMAVNSA